MLLVFARRLLLVFVVVWARRVSLRTFVSRSTSRATPSTVFACAWVFVTISVPSSVTGFVGRSSIATVASVSRASSFSFSWSFLLRFSVFVFDLYWRCLHSATCFVFIELLRICRKIVLSKVFSWSFSQLILTENFSIFCKLLLRYRLHHKLVHRHFESPNCQPYVHSSTPIVESFNLEQMKLRKLRLTQDKKSNSW